MRTTMIVQLIIVIVVFSGWTMNIIKLFDQDFEAPYKTEALRGVGLIPPIGMVTGWMDFDGESSQKDD